MLIPFYRISPVKFICNHSLILHLLLGLLHHFSDFKIYHIHHLQKFLFGEYPFFHEQGYSQLGVIVPGSTLVFIDDDNLLRRIICHEFAHCFWYIRKVIEKLDAGESKFVNAPLVSEPLERFNRQVQKDKDELVNPNDFFGKWDTENFLYGSDPALDAATEALSEHWIIKGLPTKTPLLKFDVSGKFGFCSEIKEHINNLLKIGIRTKQ